MRTLLAGGRTRIVRDSTPNIALQTKQNIQAFNIRHLRLREDALNLG
jgi:hypothetical protein